PGTFNLTAIGIRDIFISKLDADGNFVWAVQLAGEDNEYSRAIAVDAAGNVYTTGSFLDTVDFDPGPGTYNLIAMPGHENVFISKLDADGNFVWAKQIGDPVGLPGVHWNYGRAIAVDATGNVYTTGNFFSTSDFDPGAATYNLTSAGNDDIFISKLDAAGDFVWAKRMGGIGGDKGISIVVDALGNVYTTGNFQETSDFDPGGGSFNLTSDGWDDIFISKLDVGGNFVWAKQFAGMSNNYGFAIAVDENENVYSTGNFNGTTDFDPGTAIYNLTANGNPDIYISKLNAAGDFAWAKRIGANSYSGTEGGYGITVVDGFVYTVGDFGNAADFDPGPGEHWLTSTGGDDVFICKLDTLGNFVWARNYGGTTDSDMGLSIAVDANGFVYTSGYFQNTADFDPSSRTFELTSTGNTDVFVHKMSQCISTDSTLTLTACDSISINGITYDSSGYYSQILINAQGCDSTIYLNLTIDTSASITAQPSSYSKCVGNNVTFTMDATGTALHFAWQKDGIPLAGDTTNTLAFNNIQPSDDAIYTCQVSNMCGSITTDDAILKVVVLTLDAGTGSAFCNDTAVQFDAIAVSNYSAESGTISYSWSPSTGLSDTAIANPVAQPNTNTLYSLSIFDQLGCYATDTISLISITPLSMVSQPDSIQNICINDGVILNVTISGTWPFTFLWKKDGDTIPGADMPNYSIGSTAISDEGVYYCEVT
ncbi:MAG: SBBP repeat-containing protein, partial [Bacteroidetes bacterium]|nr:SBBP repeat-containing protein [Bacteroidota bacterium]